MNLSRLNSFLNWSVRVGRLFGIPIDLHITLLFFLLPVLSGRSLGFWHSVEYALLVVLSILLHELGHALAAKRYGLTGLSITLHGFGGFAVSSGYRTPKQDLVVTLAGPAVTFALGLLCLGIGKAFGSSFVFGTETWFQIFLIGYLGTLNILLGFLNLIPSLPFDGGNAVRAILSYRMSAIKSLRAVGHLGLLLGPVLLVYGFATKHDLVAMFGLLGLVTSVVTLLNTGGIRFGEVFADRRARKDLEAVKQREEARTVAFLEEVSDREREREEKERLRRLFEASGIDEP